MPRQPMHVQLNAVFLIRIVFVKLQDLPVVDNGTWDTCVDVQGRQKAKWKCEEKARHQR